jgi:hypothetical protein
MRAELRQPEGGRPWIQGGNLVAEEAALFSAPQIDHFVMAITSAKAIVRHTAPHQMT